MKKGSIRWMICLAVLLVLYIVIAFAIPFVHTATFWLSFVFTLIAFAVVAASIYIAFIKNPDAKSKFYGFPIAKIGAIYGLVSADAVVEEIQKQDAKLKKDVALMRGLQSKISQIAAHSENADVKALAEEFRYSDPVSNDAIADAEADLAAAVDELQAAFADNDIEALIQLCRKTSALLAERNRICKLNKN